MSRPARYRTVTAEPLRVDPTLLGMPLASFRRRALAYALDNLMLGMVFVTLLLGLTAWSLHRDDPHLLPALRHCLAAAHADAASRDSLCDAAFDRFVRILARRRPDVFTSDLVAQLTGDAGTGRPSIALTAGRRTRVAQALLAGGNGEHRTLVVGTDVLLGDGARLWNWGLFFLAWFTLWTRLGGGRTPAKRLLGIRVVRLDGGPLTLWTCFNRAGGYGASAATLGLGFLASRWDPNHQADHDKIVGTVVLRER